MATTTTAAMNDLSLSAPRARTSLLESGGGATTANNNYNTNSIGVGENDDNGVVLASSHHEVPRGGWDIFSEVLLLFSWIGGLVYVIYSNTAFETPPQMFELSLLVMLVLLNLTTGSLLLWRMCQRYRACVEEAQQRFGSNNNAHDSSSNVVAVERKRTVGCCCDTRSFFTVVLSLCWWFFKIRKYATVIWEHWLGWDWRRSPVSVSIGFLVGAVTIQFVTWGLTSINRKHSCSDPRFGTTPFAATAGILLLLTIVGAILSWSRRVDAIEPLLSLFSLPSVDDANGTLYDWEEILNDWNNYYSAYVYEGDAYVRNISLAEDLGNQTEVCQGLDYWDKSIRVDVDVYFGGSWACPALPDAQCETTARSEVMCNWLVFDIGEVNDWDWMESREKATAKDYYDAVQRHYHNYDNKNIDNDDYDPYGFDDDDAFDPGSAPRSRGAQWFAFTEPIFGNCGTCEAMAVSAIASAADRGCRATTDAHVFLGATIAAVVCLAAVVVPKKKSHVLEESSSPTPFAPIDSGIE